MGVQVPPPTLTFAHGLGAWRFDGAGGWPTCWLWTSWERAAALRPEARLDGHHAAGRVIGESEPELAVDLGLVLGRGGGEHAREVAEAAHQCGELLARQASVVVPGGAVQFDFR